MKKTKVKAYSYTRNGKTVHVKAHSRIDKRQKTKSEGAGGEFERRKRKESLKEKPLTEQDYEEMELTPEELEKSSKYYGVAPRDLGSWLAGGNWSGSTDAGYKRADRIIKARIGAEQYRDLDIAARLGTAILDCTAKKVKPLKENKTKSTKTTTTREFDRPGKNMVYTASGERVKLLTKPTTDRESLRKYDDGFLDSYVLDKVPKTTRFVAVRHKEGFTTVHIENTLKKHYRDTTRQTKNTRIKRETPPKKSSKKK